MCEGETSAQHSQHSQHSQHLQQKTRAQLSQLSQPFCAWRQAEMLKTALHKRAKMCKNGFSERKSDFSCNEL